MGAKKPDPPGTRYIGGKKLVPFQGPKPKKRVAVTRIGNYAQETGELPPEFAETTGRYKPKKSKKR